MKNCKWIVKNIQHVPVWYDRKDLYNVHVYKISFYVFAYTLKKL